MVGYMILGVTCFYLFAAACMGNLDPTQWSWFQSFQRQSGLILENFGRIFQLGGGFEEPVWFKVYWESTCTNEVSAIDWGTISPGESKTQAFYVKNLGSSPLTLALSTRNWNPTNADDYITLTWDYNDQPIQPNTIIRINLTLKVLSSIADVTNFSFDIVISVKQT